MPDKKPKPDVPQWVSEPPDKEGFYWTRHEEWKESPDVVKVSYYAGALRVELPSRGLDPTPEEFDTRWQEWAGPIPEPAESAPSDDQVSPSTP